MEKIIEKVVDGLLKQRDKLVDELIMINQNESSFEAKRMAIDKAIIDIDIQIENRITALKS